MPDDAFGIRDMVEALNRASMSAYASGQRDAKADLRRRALAVLKDETLGDIYAKQARLLDVIIRWCCE